MSLKKANIGKNVLNIVDEVLDVKNNAEDISKIIKGIDNVGDLGKIFNIAGVSKKTASATLEILDMADAIGDVTSAMDAFADSQKGISGVGNAFKGLFGIIKSHPIASFGTALASAVAIGYTVYKKHKQALIESATETTTAWKESNNALDEQIAKYKELKQQLDSGSLSPTQEYETRQQILDIQTQITSQYGEQVSGIDLVNGSLQTQLGLLQQISSENAKESLNGSRKEYQDAEKEMKRLRNYNLGDVTNALYDPNNTGKITKFGKELKNLVDDYEELTLITDTFGTHIEFTGDASKADTVINDFMNKVRDLSKLDGGSYATSILDSSAEALTKNQDILSKYQDNYKSFLQMDMMSQGTGKGSIADTFNQYTESVQKYNEALASGDTDKIIKARSEFALLGSEVDNLLSKDGNDKFSVLFDEITDQLSEASVKAFDFQEVLSGKKSDNNQFKKTSDDILEAGENLKKLELDAENIREALITSGEQTGESAIQTLAKAWGLDAESSTEEIYAFTDALTQAGVISGQVSNEIEDSATAFETFQTSLVSAINVVDTLNGALANSFSGKGLNVEIDEETGAIVGDIANIKAAYQGLEGYDASALFEKTANGVHINREALRALQAQQESLQKATNLEKIAELQKQLNEAMTDAKSKIGTEDYASSQLIVNDLKARLEIAQELAAAYDGATSAYQKWINAQSNGEEGDMFRTVSETMRERGNELYTEGRYNTDEFRAIADYFSNQDLSTASVEELVRAYEAAKPTIDSFFTGNKQGIDNFMASMKQMSDEGNLGWIEELENGAMKFNVSTKELADSLGISQEAVEGLLRAADEYTPIVLASDASVDFTNSIDEMQKKAEEAKSRLEELNNDGQVDLNLDFNFNSTNDSDLEEQINRAKSNLEQFKNQDGTVDLNIKGAEDAVAILQTLIQQKQQVSPPVIMSIQTDGLDEGVSNVISKLQEYYTAVNELSGLQELQSAGINIDDSQIDSAKAKVADLYSEIQGMSQNGNLQINADVSVDASSAESLTHDLEAMSPKIKAKIVPDASDLNSKEDYDKESTVTLKKDSSEPDEYEPEDKEAEVKYSVDASRVNSWRPPAKTGTVTYNIRTAGSLPQNLTRTVTYNTVVTSSGSAGSGVKKTINAALGKADGTAHAQGTVSVKVPQLYSGYRAFANGTGRDITLNENQASLVNEVGMESVVRDGRWMLIPGGAHIEQFKKGDIIFNSEQTSDLIKHGYITGGNKRGRTAMKDGTAYNLLNAYANGSGSWTFGNTGNGNIGGSGYIPSPNTTTTTPSSATSSTAVQNSASVAKNTEDAAGASEDFKENLDAIEILISHIERKIKNLERVAGSAYNTFSKRNNALREEISSITEKISVQQQGYERYLQEAESVSLSEYYKNLVRNGAIDISTITDKDLSENINKYKEWYDKALDCRDAVEELTESVRDLYKQAFDNVVTLYDGMLSQIEHRHNMLEGYVEQTEAQGYIVSTKYYDAMITNEQNKLSKLNKERQDLINALNDAIVNGDIEEGSEAWYDMQKDINNVNEAIQEANTSIIEFKNSIREIEWGIFDKIQDRISSITEEADFLTEIMSDEKMYDDKGVVTKHGTATYGLHGVNYNVYMAQADKYKKEMESIQKEISKDPYNETLIERRKELLELQQESIIAAEDEKEAIVNLVKEGIEKQLESLDKLIDKYLDALDAQKDMYDYQKKTKKLQDEINSLEKQLSAYAGDDSEEGSVRRQQVYNDLVEARENMEESLYEKAISDQKKLLDELYNEYETVLNMRLDNIDVLISEVIANINSDASEIRDTIMSEADKVGYTLTDSMNTIWGSDGTIATILTTYSSNFSSVMTSVQAAINNIYIAIQNAVNASNQKAAANISSIDQQQKQQTTVTRPMTSNKPATTTKPAAQSTGGDGVPRIGDKVTYVSGNYFYSSDGLNPSGNQMLGQEVYITNINNASWAQKPYHISRTSRLGERDLGWVSLNQLKGYKKGTNRIDRNMVAWTQEEGGELILSPYDGTIRIPGKDGMLTTLSRGDAVLNAKRTENLLSMSENPTGYIQRQIRKLREESALERAETMGGQTMNEININMTLNHVTDFKDIMTQMQQSHEAEQFIKTVVGSELMGKNSLSKYNIHFR